MHFGRMEKIESVNFKIPPDPLRTEKFLALPRETNTHLYIGCPIWGSKDWVGELYPKGTKAGQFLHYYSMAFNSVELNSSFYHSPDSAQVTRWREETPPTFRFCPKVFRGITEHLHSPTLSALIQNYCHAIAQFEEKLGLTFAQFSESFGPLQLASLKHFLNLWPTEIPLAVELRHPDWFKNGALQDVVIDLFYRKKVSTVITDTAGRRDVLHLSLTQPKVLIRFQGNSGAVTDSIRLKEWALRLAKWQKHHLQEIYFFTHQPSDVDIPKTACEAVQIMTGTPPPELHAPNQQLEII